MKKLIAILIFCLASSCFADDNLPFADKVLVKKADRKMFLLKEGKPYREYRIYLGGSPVGHKQQQGDSKTPEGNYLIDFRNSHSTFHLSLHINYPGKKDKASAKRRGVDPGGDIFIHGLPNGFGLSADPNSLTDWTLGCISVTNKEIEEIWKLVKDGTPIEILP